MTTVHELILCDVVVGDEDWFLAVEFVGNDEQFRCVICLFLLMFPRLEEGHKLSPTGAIGVFFLAVQLVDVLLAEYDALVAYGLEEVLSLCHIMECRQPVGSRCSVFHVVVFEEGA